MTDKKQKYIMLSGGFDPIHVGHIRMIKEAAEWGKVIVAVNSDEWLLRKKGYVFMTRKERIDILNEIKGVAHAVTFDDSDDTACDAIIHAIPTWRSTLE